MISIRAAIAFLVLAVVSTACSSTTTIADANGFGAGSATVSQPDVAQPTDPATSDVKVEVEDSTRRDAAAVAVENPTAEPIGELAGTQAEFDLLFARTNDVDAIEMTRTALFEMEETGSADTVVVQARSHRLAHEALYSRHVNGDFIESFSMVSGRRWMTRVPFVARASEAPADQIRGSLMDPGFYLDELQSSLVQVIAVAPAAEGDGTQWQVEMSLEGVRNAAFYARNHPLNLKDDESEVVPGQLSVTADGRISDVVLDFTGLYEPLSNFDGGTAHRAITTYSFGVVQAWSPLTTPCEEGEAVPGWTDQFECSADLDQIDLVAWERAVLAEVETRKIDRNVAGVAAVGALNACGGVSERQLFTFAGSPLHAPGGESDDPTHSGAVELVFDALVDNYCGLVPALPVRVRVEPHNATSWGEMIAVRFERSGPWAPSTEFELQAIFACSESRAPWQQISNEALLSEALWDSLSATQSAELVDLYETGDCDMLTNPTVRKSELLFERELLRFVGEDLAAQATQAQRDCVVAQVTSRGPTPAGIDAERIFIPVCAPNLVIEAHAPLYENDIIDAETATCIATALAARAAVTYKYYWGDRGPVFRNERVALGQMLNQACSLNGEQLASLAVLDD